MTSDLAVKIEKIARLAFNSAAAEGEALNAASLIVQIARKNQIDFDGFKNHLGVAAKTTKSIQSNLSDVMPFGKYEGKTFEQIFLITPSYLEWVLREVTGNKPLKARISAFLKCKQN